VPGSEIIQEQLFTIEITISQFLSLTLLVTGFHLFAIDLI
jgi:hypothetical protein